MELSLNPIMTLKMANLKTLSHAEEYSLSAISVKLLLNPITTQKIANLKKFGHTPPNHRVCLVICCLLSSRHFGAFSVEFSLNPTTA